jgi:hypothetical protein
MAGPDPTQVLEVRMIWLAVILLVAWLLGWGVFHVAGGLIHLLLVVALVVFLFRTADSVAKAGLEIVRGPLFGAALWRCYVLSAAGVQRAEIPAGEGAEEDRGRLRRRSGLRGGYLSGRTLPKGRGVAIASKPPQDETWCRVHG